MNREAYVEMARIQSAHWWYAARREILREQLRALDLPPDAQILEMGCGTGPNLPLLAEFGEVTGMEMSDEAIAFAAEVGAAASGRVRVLQGRCPDDLPRLDRRFDLVCLFDVLEHIEDDGATLAHLATVLKPGGRIMITVPAYQWMWSPNDEFVHHKRRYDRQRLSRACDDARVSVTRMTHFNTLLFPLAVAARMADRLTGRRTSSAISVPAAVVNGLFRRIFGWERHLLRRSRLPFGLSLLAVAEPRT